MTTNTCTCDSIIQGSGGQTATYRILGVLCPTCESAAEAASLPLDEWHDAKSGNASIRLYERGSGADPRNNVYPALPERYAVYALDGHEMLPRSRGFNDEAAARKYANHLWRVL